MMDPRRLENGNLVIPIRVTAENGAIGDAIKEISSADPEWERWDTYARSKGI